MKRVSIGLGILVTFFLLAMLLMVDAEVPPVNDPVATTGAAARNCTGGASGPNAGRAHAPHGAGRIQHRDDSFLSR